ncbi:hypothetical protein OEZ86_012721 [Tetradesmus obliquus]|nr:hypothetical protein OEZ86_012721 [Tetradesmus obliquus]
MQRDAEQRSGASGIRLHSDGLHGMSPRSLGKLVDMQHPRSGSPHGLAAAAGLRGNAAAPGVRFAADARAEALLPTAGSAQASKDSARMQPAASWMPMLPPAGAHGVSAVARHASPGAGDYAIGSSSSTPRQKCFKVPYQFSTPTEKRLQKQLEAVRRDPAERAALAARLEQYEAQEAPLRQAREALLAANKQQAGSLTAGAKLAALQERRAKEEERLLLAKQQHKQREEELLRQKEAAVERGEAIKQRWLQEEAEREAAALHAWQTKQWSGVVCSTCYLTQLLNSVRQMQQLQLLASQQESAVIKLQSAWRGYRQRRKFLQLREAVRLLQAAFRSHLGNPAQRSSRAHSAAECLLRFVVAFHGQSQLRLVVKHVQHAVLKDVRLEKQLNLQRTAQHLLLTNQWIALECKMIALARKRAGADVITAPAKGSTTQSKLAAQLEARKKGTALATSRPPAADDAPCNASSSSSPAGPGAASCHINDRLLPEDLSPSPLKVKGLLAQVYLKLKAEAYVAVIGRTWKELAVHKRACREHGNLAAARSILRGASQAGAQQQAGSEAGCSSSSSSAAAVPQLPPFRATATLQELAVLMQQAAAETPHYEAVIAKQNLDGYMAKLEQELAARKESTSSATSPADTFDGSNGDTDGSPALTPLVGPGLSHVVLSCSVGQASAG